MSYKFVTSTIKHFFNLVLMQSFINDFYVTWINFIQFIKQEFYKCNIWNWDTNILKNIFNSVAVLGIHWASMWCEWWHVTGGVKQICSPTKTWNPTTHMASYKSKQTIKSEFLPRLCKQTDSGLYNKCCMLL